MTVGRSRVRIAASLATTALPLCASAQDALAPSDTCPIPALQEQVRYERWHQIPTKPAHDDITHKVVTPGGMVLDTPKMVAVRDVLSIAARDHTAVCFNLLTYARDRHMCKVSGVGRSESGDKYLFREDEMIVRFTFLDSDQVRVEPVGTGVRKQCEGSGKIERAVYRRSASGE
jgi:hypothetical protein